MRAASGRLLASAISLACAGLVASPAQAKAHKKSGPSIRAEDDPALAGDAPAFANAQLSFRAPHDGAELAADAGVLVQLELQGYALGPAPGAAASDPFAPAGNPGGDAGPALHAEGDAGESAIAGSDPAASGSKPSPARAPFALLLVDNDGALRLDSGRPVRLRGLAPGPHLLRAVLSRPWGEVVKAKGALAMVRFWIGPRTADSTAARSAEEKAWPDPKKPLLTYVFPLGELRSGLSLETSAGTRQDDASAWTELAPAAIPDPLALDFHLSAATLKEKGRGDKIRVVVNKRELPIVRVWRPLPLSLQPGKNRITIDLLDRRGTKVKNAVNRTDRTIVMP